MKFSKIKISLCLLLMIFVTGICLTGCGEEKKPETNVSSIEIENYKKDFYYGESFKLTGTMIVKYKDGSTKTLDLVKDAGVNYLIDESGIGERNATIFYDNYEYTIPVNYIDYEKIYGVLNLTSECYKGDSISYVNAKALVYNASEGPGEKTLSNCRKVSLTDSDIEISNADTSLPGDINIKIVYKNNDLSSYYHELKVKTTVADFDVKLEESYWFSSVEDALKDTDFNIEFVEELSQSDKQYKYEDLKNNSKYIFEIKDIDYVVGTTTFTISIDGVEKEFEITVRDYVVIESISNLKTEFVVGDEFSFGEGAQVTAKYVSNNSEVTVNLNLDDFDIEGFDSTKENDQLTIKIVSKTCSLTTYIYSISVVNTQISE